MIITVERYKLLAGVDSADTSSDEKIKAFIALVESDYLSIRNKKFEQDEHSELVYPTGAESTAFAMLSFKLDTATKIGCQSESIGDYSYSRDTANLGLCGYPKAITSSIKRFANVI